VNLSTQSSGYDDTNSLGGKRVFSRFEGPIGTPQPVGPFFCAHHATPFLTLFSLVEIQLWVADGSMVNSVYSVDLNGRLHAPHRREIHGGNQRFLHWADR
jgi:hypothetical protein